MDIFQAIAAPIRRKIVHQLATSGDLPITAIANDFPISRQAVRKHIQMLEGSGLLTVKKMGREQLCRLNLVALKEVYEWVAFYQRFWDDKLDDLDDYLAKKG